MLIPTFDQFVNESTDWSSRAFEAAIDDEMSWQSGSTYEVEGDDFDVKEFYGKLPKEFLPKSKRFFMYVCPAGSSVRKDLLKACADRGYTTAKVAVVDNKFRNTEHRYLLGLPE